MPVNPILLQQVKAAMASKRAFVPPQAGGAPPGGDPAAAGAPPMDPSMMGGAGAPPMDPSMMGGAGAPPMDPAMMGGAPPMDPAAMAAAAPPAPPAPAPGPSADEIRALIQEEMQKAQGGGVGADGKPKSKGAGKVDPTEMLAYMERQQKLLVNLYESLGLSLPYNILDKPASPDEQQPPEEPGKEKGPSANVGGIPPIKPIEPIGGKQASLMQKAQAARYMLNAMQRKG